MKPLLLLLLLPFLPIAADTWQPFAIDQRVTVQFPRPPAAINLAKLTQSRQLGHMRAWMLRASEGTYQVLRTHSKSMLGKQDTARRRSFYAGGLSALLQSERGQLVAQTFFSTAGGEGVEYKYKATERDTGKRTIKFMRCLVVDSIGYSLNFVAADKLDTLGLAGNEQRRRFFNSITVKP
jgi:hypothetical protein